MTTLWVFVDDLPGQLERSQFLSQHAEQERRGVLALQRLVMDGDPDGDIIAERGEDRRQVERFKCPAVPGQPSGHAAKHTDHPMTGKGVLMSVSAAR
jgi:hypothetical protein